MDKWKTIKIGIICVSVLLFLLSVKIKQDKVYLNVNEKEMYASPLLWGDYTFEEVFFVDHEMPLCLQVRPIKWNYTHEDGEFLEVKLKRVCNGEIIMSHTLYINSLPNNSLTDYIFFDNVKIEKEEWYSIVLECNISDQERGIGFMCTEKRGDNSYAVLNGERQNYNLSMILYE